METVPDARCWQIHLELQKLITELRDSQLDLETGDKLMSDVNQLHNIINESSSKGSGFVRNLRDSGYLDKWS